MYPRSIDPDTRRLGEGLVFATFSSLLTGLLILGLIFAMGAWAGEQYRAKWEPFAHGLEFAI